MWGSSGGGGGRSPFRREDEDNNPFSQFFKFIQQGDLNKALRLGHLSQTEREHLWRVYATLLSGVFSTGGGVLIGGRLMNWNILGPPGLGFIGLIGTLIASGYVMRQRAANVYGANPKSSTNELIAFEAASLFSGLSISTIVIFAAHFYINVLITALLGSMAIFMSLTMASLLAPRRSMLYLGGILGTIASYLFLASLANLFFRSPAMRNIQTLGGIVLGAGYTLVDTQLTLQNSREGGSTVVSDALALYMDLLQLFVHLLANMLDKERQSRNNSKQSRRG